MSEKNWLEESLPLNEDAETPSDEVKIGEEPETENEIPEELLDVFKETEEISEDASEENTEETENLTPAGNAFDWIKSFLFSLTAVIFVFTLLFRGVTVSGDSMLPTLSDREYLVISDLFYTPKPGDIVVVQPPNYKNGTEPIIKRIIATEGQTVSINFNTWQVWVDGFEVEEDYVYFEPEMTMNAEDMLPDENGLAEVKVKENCIFVMGDHRNDSLDSRSELIGHIDQRYIMGRVVLRLSPLNKIGKVK